MPFRRGGLGLSSAGDVRHAASGASWADMVAALRNHHPGAVAKFMRMLQGLAHAEVRQSNREAEQAAECLHLRGFQGPTWAMLLEGLEGLAPPDSPSLRPCPNSDDVRLATRRQGLRGEKCERNSFSDLDPALTTQANSKHMYAKRNTEFEPAIEASVPHLVCSPYEAADFRSRGWIRQLLA